jgi:hypothetical protein
MSLLSRLTATATAWLQKIPSIVPDAVYWAPYRLADVPFILTLVCGSDFESRENTAFALQASALKKGRIVLVLSLKRYTHHTCVLEKATGRQLLKATMRTMYGIHCNEILLIDDTDTFSEREYWCDKAWIRRFLYVDRPLTQLSTAFAPVYTLAMLAPHEAACYTAHIADTDRTVGELWADEGYQPIA